MRYHDLSAFALYDLDLEDQGHILFSVVDYVGVHVKVNYLCQMFTS